MIGDVTHRVDVFLGWPGGDQHMFAGERLALEALGGAPGQVGGFEHAAKAHVAAGLAAGSRPEHLDATGLEQVEVGLGRRVAPHGLVHGRGHCHGGVGGQYQGSQQVVGHALGHAGHEVGGGGGDQHQVGPFGQFDVAHGRFGGRVEQIHVYRVAGQRLQGQRGDEFSTTTGHDDAHLRAVLQESANQLGALVGGNAAPDAENDALAIQPLHRLAFFQRERAATNRIACGRTSHVRGEID
ncbi:hypothetical protein D3C78_859250 [compost metagenome]